jgi:two-component system phosphate regulon response regulator PhoB
MGTKILVVDDNPDAIAIVKSALEARGYTVNTAERGALALSSVDTDRPDVILLDIMMPDMSGLEVLEKLKATPSTSSIPVILVTAKTQDDDVISGYAVGAEYYITKPFTTRQLMYGVNLVLGQQGERSD